MVCGTVVPVRALLGIDFVMFRIVAAALGNVSPVKKNGKKKKSKKNRAIPRGAHQVRSGSLRVGTASVS
jgi:hypothetical protein